MEWQGNIGTKIFFSKHLFWAYNFRVYVWALIPPRGYIRSRRGFLFEFSIDKLEILRKQSSGSKKMYHFFLKNRVGWFFFLTFFLKIGWGGFFLKKRVGGSKPPTFFLKHHGVANYNIGRLMQKLLKKRIFLDLLIKK